MPEVGEVLVKTLAVGICAGDAKCYAGAPYFWGEQHWPSGAMAAGSMCNLHNLHVVIRREALFSCPIELSSMRVPGL